LLIDQHERILVVETYRYFSVIAPFSELPETEMRALAHVAIPKRYDTGDTLFYEGDPCQGIWIVIEGAVKIMKASPSGRQLVLATQQAPSTIAEVPVFDGGPYPATVSAIGATQTLLLLTSDFLAACQRNPTLPLRFLHVFGSRLRHLVGLVERITFGSIRQRLATELLSFADQAGTDRFQLPETHEELATRLGTVREVVSRNLGRFQSEGMLRVQRKDIEILSRTALETEAATEL